MLLGMAHELAQGQCIGDILIGKGCEHHLALVQTQIPEHHCRAELVISAGFAVPPSLPSPLSTSILVFNTAMSHEATARICFQERQPQEWGGGGEGVVYAPPLA